MSGSFLHVRCLPRWFWPLCLICFAGAVWAGAQLFRKNPPPQPVAARRSITLIFHVYDTKGNALTRARLTGPAPPVIPQLVQGSDCLLTKPEGSAQELFFAHGARTKTERIVWRSAAEFERWLDEELPGHLQQLDPSYDRQNWQGIVRRIKGRIRSTKYDYPIAFPGAP